MVQAGLGGSVGCASDWRPGGRGFDPCRGRQHSFMEIDHELFSRVNGFSSNLVCALILWRSGLGLLMCKILSIFDGVICPRQPIFSFPDYNLSK